MIRLRRPGLPTSAARELDGAARRTLVLRLGLVVGAVALAAGALLASTKLGARPTSYFASGGGGVVVLDVSTSVEPRKYQRIQRVLSSLSETSTRVGLVVFSDVAYEMFPPGTHGEELAGADAVLRAASAAALRPDPPVSPRRPTSPAAAQLRARQSLGRDVPRRHADLPRPGRGSAHHPARRYAAHRDARQRPRRLCARYGGADAGADPLRGRRDRPPRRAPVRLPGGSRPVRAPRRRRGVRAERRAVAEHGDRGAPDARRRLPRRPGRRRRAAARRAGGQRAPPAPASRGGALESSPAARLRGGRGRVRGLARARAARRRRRPDRPRARAGRRALRRRRGDERHVGGRHRAARAGEPTPARRHGRHRLPRRRAAVPVRRGRASRSSSSPS